MVTLQGVIILRISDFRKFFDWNEFWTKKEMFLKFFSRQSNIDFFVNNDRERLLVNRLYYYLRQPSRISELVRLEPEELKIITNNNDVEVYSLGLLREKIAKARQQKALTTNAIIGHTLLYLLLQANENNNVDARYIDKANNIQYLYGNEELTHYDGELPLNGTFFEHKVLVNQHNSKIRIGFKRKSYELQPQECIVGIFHKDKCYALLPNSKSINGLNLQLVIDPDSKRTRLKITGKVPVDFRLPSTVQICSDDNGDIAYRYIDDVISFVTEGYGSALAVVDCNGRVEVPTSWVLLSERISKFNNQYPGESILHIAEDTVTVITNTNTKPLL